MQTTTTSLPNLQSHLILQLIERVQHNPLDLPNFIILFKLVHINFTWFAYKRPPVIAV
jgi:hypothetical protein